MTTPSKAIVIGISGCSSSGKTTLSRILKDLFPNTFILHEDDFYRPEAELPRKEGLTDWDCAESLDIAAIATSLKYVRGHGELPPDINSREDQNTTGPCPVPDTFIAALESKIARWTNPGFPGAILLSPSSPRICIFEGFLLYAQSMAAIQPLLDVKIFLQVSYAKAKERREARSGYVTLEGFWEDPPGYVDKIVWPNYVSEHEDLFEGGDMQGKVKDEVRNGGLRCQVGVDGEMSDTLGWAVDLLMEELPALMRRAVEV